MSEAQSLKLDNGTEIPDVSGLSDEELQKINSGETEGDDESLDKARERDKEKETAEEPKEETEAEEKPEEPEEEPKAEDKPEEPKPEEKPEEPKPEEPKPEEPKPEEPKAEDKPEEEDPYRELTPKEGTVKTRERFSRLLSELKESREVGQQISTAYAEANERLDYIVNALGSEQGVNRLIELTRMAEGSPHERQLAVNELVKAAQNIASNSGLEMPEMGDIDHLATFPDLRQMVSAGQISPEEAKLEIQRRVQEAHDAQMRQTQAAQAAQAAQGQSDPQVQAAASHINDILETAAVGMSADNKANLQGRIKDYCATLANAGTNVANIPGLVRQQVQAWLPEYSGASTNGRRPPAPSVKGTSKTARSKSIKKDESFEDSLKTLVSADDDELDEIMAQINED